MEPTIQRTETHVWLDPKPKDPPFPVAEITRGASNPKPPYNLCSCNLGVSSGWKMEVVWWFLSFQACILKKEVTLLEISY